MADLKFVVRNRDLRCESLSIVTGILEKAIVIVINNINSETFAQP